MTDDLSSFDAPFFSMNNTEVAVSISIHEPFDLFHDNKFRRWTLNNDCYWSVLTRLWRTVRAFFS